MVRNKLFFLAVMRILVNSGGEGVRCIHPRRRWLSGGEDRDWGGKGLIDNRQGCSRLWWRSDAKSYNFTNITDNYKDSLVNVYDILPPC